MARKLTLGIMGLAAVMMLSGCGGTSSTENVENTDSTVSVENTAVDATDIIMDIPTTQYFTDEEVSQDDMTKILTAGINSPSGMNSQSWHFTVVTDKTLLNQMAEEMSANMPEQAASDGSERSKAEIADAPAVIFISANEGTEFDAGIVCEGMCCMANVLGYGTKILGSPSMILNGDKQAEYKELLSIPDDMIFQAAILVGKADESVDGYSGATERNAFDDTVTYVAE